jgi:hypothetical protein
VQVSLWAACNPTTEETSVNSAREPIDFLSMAAATSLVIVHRVPHIPFDSTRNGFCGPRPMPPKTRS